MSVKIIFVLDESGSMGTLRQDVIGGFNTLIEDQKQVEGAADVTLITFNTVVKTVFQDLPLLNVQKLDSSDYSPSGGTAMNDAIGIALSRVLVDAPEKAIINIFTDGYENSSREYSAAQVKELVKQAEEKGYQIVFLAANIDEVAVGSTFGLERGATRGFTADAKGMEFAYSNASASTQAYRTGAIQ
jgi:uncharacterized protein YegL